MEKLYDTVHFVILLAHFTKMKNRLSLQKKKKEKKNIVLLLSNIMNWPF